MFDRDRLDNLLELSSDPDNPGPEEVRDLLLDSHTVAVVGMSRDPSKVARRVPSYLAAHGFELYPVNPNATRILGRPARATLSEVDEPVDMVLLYRPSAEVGPFVEDAAARAERPAIWLPEGVRSDPEARRARDEGLLVIQDLCVYKVHRVVAAEPTLRRSDQLRDDRA